MTSPTPDYARVIFRPNVEAFSKEITRRYFRDMAMTDHGDHVEWTDGKRTTKMRLPDQPDPGAGYPELHTLLIATLYPSLSYTPGRASSDRVRFLDSGGRVIAWLDRRGGMTPGLLEIMLPYPDAYQPLTARGVRIEKAAYEWEKQFYEDHPDPLVQGGSLAFARHPLVFMAVLAVIALLAALLITVL